MVEDPDLLRRKRKAEKAAAKEEAKRKRRELEDYLFRSPEQESDAPSLGPSRYSPFLWVYGRGGARRLHNFLGRTAYKTKSVRQDMSCRGNPWHVSPVFDHSTTQLLSFS